MKSSFAYPQGCPPVPSSGTAEGRVPAAVAAQLHDLEDEVAGQRRTIDQLKSAVADLLTEYSDHTHRIPDLQSGEDPLIVIVRSLVSSLHGRNRCLEEENREARSVARTKSEILANMSHEIRTPMHGIFGMVNLVLDTELKPNQREYIDTIRSSTESLLTILNDVLDYSKLSSSEVTLEPRRFSTRRLLDEVVRTFSANAGEKGLRLETGIGPEVPDELIGDDHRLRQILSNLVGNAIKFTTSGRISIEIGRIEPARDEWVPLHFRVTDTGPGIGPAVIDQLFQPFTQGEASTSRRFGGTGLGLTISKNLVELMGGKIWVESELGQGSVFQFTSRLRIASPTAGVTDLSPIEVTEAGISPFCEDGRSSPSDPQQSDPVARRVLLVEDNEVNQRVGQLSLEKFGFDVDVAGDGVQAIELARANAYEVICMDVQMPEMDGIEATRHIRHLDAPSSRARIIAMTGHAFSAHRQRCLDCGMDAFITKPFDLIELKTTLDRLLGLLPEDGVTPTSVVAADALATDENSGGDPVALSA